MQGLWTGSLSPLEQRIATLERQLAADSTELRAAQLRQRCLTELGDRLRGCDTPGQISAAVSDILGRALGCARTGYAVIDGDSALIDNDWTNGTVSSLSGHYAFASLGSVYVATIQSGDLLVVADVQTHPAIAESVDSWSAIQVSALLNVPLLDNGRLVGLLYAHESFPRAWTGAEVSLVKEVADRTWEAMGRAGAVEALRHLNQTLEVQIQERTLQRDRMWTLSTDIMMVTTREGKILSVNPAWTRLLGWDENDLVGAFFYQFVHPDDVALTRCARQKLEYQQLLDKLENRYRTKAGGFVWLSWKAVPDGDVIHSVGRDVTAEREQAEALRAAEEALRQAQKMEAVGQLTGGIAHDFNNLLQGILGSLALAQKRIAEGQIAGLAEYHAQAVHSAERASALIQRLLAFSRRQTLDPQPLKANALVTAMEPLLRRTVGEAIQLEFDLAPDLWTILCDANQLDSAILNLVINARDAMPNGGTLKISSCNVSDISGAGRICLAVGDTGSGMAPDVVERAFEPFYTTKPIGQGTGLGLSMVYGFMQQSGGEAKIESTAGQGTVVKLLLQRYVGPEASDVVTLPPSVAPVSGRGTVLVLEDEFLVRVVVVEVLEELGFKIIEADDGPSGLAILQASCDIDLLVTDIGLPGLNGRQVAEAARLVRPGLKVLFMSGYADKSVVSEGFLAPGMEMIAKPFAIEALGARVRQMIGG